MNGLVVALLVFCFGGLGSAARYLVHQRVLRDDPSAFPLGTFLVNMLGALLIGVLFGAAVGSELTKVASAGFLGGFTTFSTWIYETERLAVDGYPRGAARNVAISSVVGFLAVALGVLVGQQL